MPNMELAHLEKLADELIELRCGTHSLGNVYEYLLKAYGDANRAKQDFIRFLSGDLMTPILETAAEWVAEEQDDHLETEIARPPGSAHQRHSFLQLGGGSEIVGRRSPAHLNACEV
jgi:hypothetical protein